ncbi:E3 ubiquitin-protein ligase MIB2-like isoform X2 [Octopus sinensis]|uniref:E3 ubiquitin-protein ligase MIB2-like isoform X2 n=1 Tax=Octopus sinensis TaxID=2607531 RepID=A0A6P7TST6_9MOLL|nr:E3 ubiquitin-protein ligase MIB2-like isoform X2 [Octopus sinensis]
MSSLSSLQINKPFDGSGITPLMWACYKGADRRIIEVLLKAGAELEAKDRWGRSALHLAVWSDHLHAVEILLSRGCDVNPRNVNGQTPLHRACWWGHLHTVDLLLGHNGIDANVVDNDGDTPLHVAIRRRNYKVVCAMLKQDSVNLEIVNKEYRTPLLEAVSDGHLGIMQRLIARDANVNAVDHGGNNCLHLALKRKNNFHSEVEHMTMLDQYLKDLKLGKKKRYSDVVVACYLAHHGANFYCKNKCGRTPLDLIEKENFKKTLNMLFRPTQCVFCEDEVATETFFPCKHLSLCKKCCPPKIPKRCPTCGQKITSKNSLEGPKSSKPEVQMLAEPPVNRTFEVKETQTLAEPVVNRTFEVKETQTLAEPVVRPKVEDKASQTEAQPLDILTLEVKHLHRVSKKLAGKWQQLGRELEITDEDLQIVRHENPYNIVEQGYQMLLKWFQSCDPAKRTPQTLKEALLETECFVAAECLLSDFS